MYSHLVFVGNLGGDPEMRYTAEGTPVCNFSMAVNRRWNNAQGETQSEVTWLRVTCWRALAENVNQYLSKGRQVLVEGRLQVDPDTGGPRVWVGNDGQARASFEITALTVKFLGSRADGSAGESALPEGTVLPEEPPSASEDEIPF